MTAKLDSRLRKVEGIIARDRFGEYTRFVDDYSSAVVSALDKYIADAHLKERVRTRICEIIRKPQIKRRWPHGSSNEPLAEHEIRQVLAFAKTTREEIREFNDFIVSALRQALAELVEDVAIRDKVEQEYSLQFQMVLDKVKPE